MILAKPTLKILLNSVTEDTLDYSKDERTLQKELKCSALKYNMYSQEEDLCAIFKTLINLCVITHPKNL